MAARDDLAGAEPHDLEVLGRRLDLADELRRERPDHGPVGVDDLADDLRLVELAAVGEGRVRVEDLERRRGVVALADARLEDLAREDRLAEGVLLPLVRRDDARAPRRAGRCPSSRRTRAGAPSRRGARSRGAGPSGRRTCRSSGRSRSGCRAVRTPRGSSPRTCPGRSGCTACVWTSSVGPSFLSARTPRPVTSLYVDPGGNCSLIAWLRSGFSGFLSSFWKSLRLIPSANLLLSYVGRLTIARISPVCGFITIITPRLRFARFIAQVDRLLGETLLLRVDGQDERVARLSLAIRREDLELPAGRIALDGLLAVDAAERRLVRGLDSGLADQVVGLVALVLERLERLGIDRARVADELRDQGPVGVVTLRLHRDLDAGERQSLLRDQVGRRNRDVLGHTNEIEPGSGVRIDRHVDVGLVDPEQGRQAGDDLVALREREVGGPDLDRVARLVRHEQAALPVVDQPPRAREAPQ